MLRNAIALAAILLAAAANSPNRAAARPPNPAPLMCTSAATPHVRTTLYFGLARESASVTERQWKRFLRNEVTPRFPAGLTVWEANGQWRSPNGHITEERSKVLMLVHQDTPQTRAILAELVTLYKTAFHQESVLWESAPVCAGF